MGVFNTERTPDYERKLQSLIETNQVRQRNLASLKEDAAMNKQNIAMEAALAEIDRDDAYAKKVATESYLGKISAERARVTGATAMMTLENRLAKEGYDKCMETAIFNIVYEAFWADDIVKERTIPQMLECYRNTVEVLEKCGVSKKKEAEESCLVKNVKEACSNTAEKASKRIANEACGKGTEESCGSKCSTKEACGVKSTEEACVKEGCSKSTREACLKEGCCKTAKEACGTRKLEESCKQGCKKEELDQIDFTLNDDEASELDDNLASLGSGDIAELVKAKVLSVINDEMEASARKDEMFKDIDEKSKELTDDMDNDDDDMDDEEKTATSESAIQAMITRANNDKMNRLTGTSLFECILMHSMRSVDEQIATEGVQATSDEVMDAAFMETVLTYTVLETLQTLKLYDFNNSTVRTLREHYKSN